MRNRGGVAARVKEQERGGEVKIGRREKERRGGPEIKGKGRVTMER